METKQIVMLTFMLLIAVIGCWGLVHTMMNLDNNDDDNGNHDDHHGH